MPDLHDLVGRHSPIVRLGATGSLSASGIAGGLHGQQAASGTRQLKMADLLVLLCRAAIGPIVFTPKGLHNIAQGCLEEATLGETTPRVTTRSASM